MIVNCEECGARYSLDESRIKGKSVKARCKRCGHVMLISKPEGSGGETEAESAPSQVESAGYEAGPSTSSAESGRGEATSASAPSTAYATGGTEGAAAGGGAPGSTLTAARGRGRGLGLRGKMFFLFVLIPIALMIVASFLYIRQMERLQSMSTERSLQVVQEAAVSQVSQKARDVAKQIDIYLSSHPELEASEFIRDPRLRRLSVQKIGEAGYTFLYGQGGQDDSWRILVHINREILGANLSELPGKPPKLKDILQQAKNGREAGGYYKEQVQNKGAVEKYIYCAPVGQTNYVVAATTEVEPLLTPARVIQTRIYKVFQQIRTQIIIGLGVLIVIIFVLVSWFGYRITKRILYLSDVAERISVGDLAAEIHMKGKDEVAMLADSISRMQQSVRLSIERLRRRR